MKICAHTLVKNEERYLWFAVTSIIDHVDKVLIWDTGSTDNTVLIIKELIKKYPKKVSFKEVGNVDINEFTKVRQEMLEETKADWVFILDGDEVWWDDSIRKVVETINKDGNELETIVNRYCNIVGDIYHYQDEAAGRYEIDGRRGHLTIRAMNCNIPGLKYLKPHGQQGVFDENGNLIQERDKGKRYFIERSSYLHFTHMIRSSNLSEDLKVAKRKIKMYNISFNMKSLISCFSLCHKQLFLLLS